MGTEFFWFYDIIFIAILLFNIFVGLKRGFVRMLLSMFSTAIAFVLAFLSSGFVTDWVYSSFIGESLQTAIAEKVNESLSGTVVAELASLDFDKVTIGGESISTISVEPDDAGKITVKLDDVDLSKTGIDKIDLTAFGVSKDTDFSNIDLGTVQFYESELENNSITDLIRAQYVADSIEKTEAMEEITKAIDDISDKLPVISGVNDSGNDGYLFRNVVTTVVNAGGDPGDAIVDNMIKPVICSLIRTLIFIILFVIIKLLLSIIIKATNIVNKIPLINKFNEFFGGVMGLVHGVIVVFIVVILVHLTVLITDNTLIFLNEMTIDKSFAFNWIYNFKFLDFISKLN